MVIIKKIKVLPLAKIIGFLYGVAGFGAAFTFFFYYVVGIISQGLAVGRVIPFLAFNLFFGLLFALAGAFAAGAFGFLQGFLIATVYNFLSGRIGCLELEIMPEEEEKRRRLRECWSAAGTAIPETAVKKHFKKKNKN